MGRLFEDFFSNQWNLYGLQVLAGSLMVMISHQYLTIFQMCIMALCVYLVGVCQRILGIRFGMLYYDFHKRRMVNMMNKLDEVYLKQKKKKVKVKRRKKK